MWANKYIGIPFEDKGRSEKALDCWGLVMLVYIQEKEIVLPGYLELYEKTTDREKLEALMKIPQGNQWMQVDSPAAFDIVLLRVGGFESHVGIMVDKNTMIHAQDGVAVALEKVDSIRWKNKVAGYFRYAGK